MSQDLFSFDQTGTLITQNKPLRTLRTLWLPRHIAYNLIDDIILQISDLITGATRELRLEVATLEEKLRESCIRYTEDSESKEKEIKNLKNVVAEFESRLKKEIASNDSVSEDLRKEMQQKSDELERVMLAQTQLIQQFNEAQEQVRSRGRWHCHQ